MSIRLLFSAVILALGVASCAKHQDFPAKRTLAYWHSQEEHWSMHPDWAIKNATKIKEDAVSEQFAAICRKDAEDAIGCRISSYGAYELKSAPIRILKFEVNETWKEGAWRQTYDGRLVFYIDMSKHKIVSAHGGSE